MAVRAQEIEFASFPLRGRGVFAINQLGLVFHVLKVRDLQTQE